MGVLVAVKAVGLEVAARRLLGREVGLDELLCRFEVAGRAVEALGRRGEKLLGEGVDGLAGGLALRRDAADFGWALDGCRKAVDIRLRPCLLSKSNRRNF